MGTITITDTYKILEAKSILKNKERYSALDIDKAKKLLSESNFDKIELPIVTDEQRAEIKKRYPKTYPHLKI